MALFKVEDRNGKSFDVNTDTSFRISGDIIQDSKDGNSCVSDSAMPKNRVAVLHDVEYVSPTGEVLDAQKLIKDVASGKTNIVALDVNMEATHSGKNRNYCIYYEDSMEKDAESMINPFQKPFLKNHNSYDGEPIGRIRSSYFGESKLTDERSAIHLNAVVTDAEAIPKFLDGRYKTVSIAGAMGTVTCNICGKTILKDGKFKFCGHWRGETYKDQVCYWGARDIEYREVSVVNTPADDYAQVMKITVITDEDAKDSINNNNNKEEDMADNKPEAAVKDTTEQTQDQQTTQVSDGTTSEPDVCGIIDEMLSNNEGKTEDSTDKTENTNESTSEESQQAKSTEDSLKEKEEELKTVKDELESVKSELAVVKRSLADKQKEFDTLQIECDSYKDKCISLATANKNFIIDKVLSKENVAEDKKEERKEELLKMSSRELNSILEKDSATEQPTRTMASVDNPTLANPTENSNSKTTDAINNTDNRTAKKTVDDFAREIVGKLIK